MGVDMGELRGTHVPVLLERCLELLAPALPPLPHLALVCTAMFLGLLLPRLVTRPAVVAALVGGLTAAVVSQLLPALGIVAGAVAGVAAACTVHRPSSRS